MAPLTIEFEEDADCRNVLHQYLLGRDLMVSIYKRETVFPSGRWKDFWTGEVIEGGQALEIDWPESRGGGLFVREGGVVPMGPVMQYRGEKPLDEVELYVFPGATESRMELYEDDGITLKHLDGAFAVTAISTQEQAEAVTVEVDGTQGTFDGQCENRTWAFCVALDAAPDAVLANGNPVAQADWAYDEDRRELQIAPQAGPVQITIRKAK